MYHPHQHQHHDDDQAGWKEETFVLAGRGVQLDGIATAPGIVTAEVPLHHLHLQLHPLFNVVLSDAQVGEGYQAVVPISPTTCSLEWLLDCTYGGALPQVNIVTNHHYQH